MGNPLVCRHFSGAFAPRQCAVLGFAEGKLFVVDNYLEGVGVMTALKAGVALSSVRRPFGGTFVCSECFGAAGVGDDAGAVERREVSF